MLSGKSLAAHLEAVTVTGLDELCYSVAVLVSVEITVLVSYRVLNYNPAYLAGLRLCIEIPAVIGVEVCDTSVEYVAFAYRKLAGISVGVLVTVVGVLV